jgi:glucose/arabinose dehydrogenase/mono/diheme cytochrome c family protein
MNCYSTSCLLTVLLLFVGCGGASPGADVTDNAAEQSASAESAENGFAEVYKSNCAVCHGDALQGAAQGAPLVGTDLQHGDSLEDIASSIRKGYPERGMPAWETTLPPESIRNLAIYVAEQRQGIVDFIDFNIYNPLTIPTEPIETRLYSLGVEVVIEDIAALPYSIAPLPDGRILLSEKLRGLSVISTDGRQSALIAGLPTIYGEAVKEGPIKYGNGWMLDVALHPDYADNGWIYLSYGDRCQDCNAVSREMNLPVSMNKLIRGRLRDGLWIDSEIIWSTEFENYTPSADVVAGGRITFDGQGHVFMSVGMKGMRRTGIQDLSKPYGKIHRVHEDGRIPDDNPFIGVEGAVPSTWSFGHRSPQGLEYDRLTDELWGTEMGPRGGDELNRLIAGGNFGWPLFSLGAEYDGRAVDDGERLGVEWSMEDIQQPVVDLTPGPAVSSFVIYRGDVFPLWRDHFIVGSLKGTNLYRFELKKGQLVDRELMYSGMGRIRDIEVDPQGAILLLLEHDAGSKIVRLVPQVTPSAVSSR